MKTLLPVALAALAAGFAGGYFARNASGLREPAPAPSPRTPADAPPVPGQASPPEDLSESQREIVRLQGQLDLLLATLDAHDRINLLKVLERLDKVENETRTQRDQLNDALGNPAGGAVVTLRYLDGEVARRESELKDLNAQLKALWERLGAGREEPGRPDSEARAREKKLRAKESRKGLEMLENPILREARSAENWEDFYEIARDFGDEEMLEFAIADRLFGALERDDPWARVHLDALIDDEQAAITAEVVRFCGGEDELLRRATAGGAITSALHVEIRRIRTDVRRSYDPFYRMWFSDRDLAILSAQLRTEAAPEIVAEGPSTAPGTRRIRVGGGIGP